MFVLGKGEWLGSTHCVGRCLCPSESVSQQCPWDWSLSLVPRLWGGASQLWVQPVLLSHKRLPRRAGRGCGLKLSRSDVGEQRSLVLRLSRSSVITGLQRSDQAKGLGMPPAWPPCLTLAGGPGWARQQPPFSTQPWIFYLPSPSTTHFEMSLCHRWRRGLQGLPLQKSCLPRQPHPWDPFCLLCLGTIVRLLCVPSFPG